MKKQLQIFVLLIALCLTSCVAYNESTVNYYTSKTWKVVAKETFSRPTVVYIIIESMSGNRERLQACKERGHYDLVVGDMIKFTPRVQNAGSETTFSCYLNVERIKY